MGRVIKASLRMVRFIIANRKDREAIRDQWNLLRVQILRDWPVQLDEGAEHLGWVPEDHPDLTVRLEHDISYYSDRWCAWRVEHIDRTIDAMMRT